MKILIGEPIAQEAVVQMKAAGAMVESLSELDAPLEAVIGAYDGLVVGQQLRIDAELLAKADRLRVIGKIGKDTSNIDISAATRAGIAIVNTSQGVSASLAEYNILALLSLARLGTDKGGLGSELKGKTLGIIGLGNVGSQVAKRAKAFDMRVVCYDPSVSRARAMMCEVELMELVDVLILSDYVTIHVPLNEETRGLLNRDSLSLMRQGAALVNTAEPEVCDLPAVAEALASGKLKGVVMDFPWGYEAAQERLAAFDHAVITENRAAATAEARVGTAVEVVAEMLSFWQNGYSKNAINIPLLKESQRQSMMSYCRLAKTLGDFAGQLCRGPVQQIRLCLGGDIAQLDEQPLVQWALTVFLGHQTKERINYVNAGMYARDHDISVVVDKSDERGDYPNYMSIEVYAGGETRFIAASVKASGGIKLVQVDQFTMDVRPQPHFLLIPHQNRPGMIGKVGTILGQYGVNISGMVVGRRREDDLDVAMMVMTVDESVSQPLLAALEACDGVLAVHDVNLTMF